MTDVKILLGGDRPYSELLSSGAVRVISEYPVAFTNGGQSVVVRPTIVVPAKASNGNFLIPPLPGTLFPGDEAYHSIGDVEVHVQLTPLPRAARYNGPDEYLFSYEVMRALRPSLTQKAA